MTRKPVIAAAAAMFALVLPLTACSSSKPTTTSPEAPADADAPVATSVTAPDKASKNYNVQFIQGVAGDEFYISMQCGAEAEAAELGVSVTTQGPQKFDPTLQRPILDSVSAAQPDAIFIAPTDVTAMQAPLEKAAQSGV